MPLHLHLYKETRNDHCNYTYIIQKTLANFSLIILVEENKKLFSSSDDEDFNLDSTLVPPSWNGFINLAETSDQEQLTSVGDVGSSNHSMTCIQSEKSKRLFCKNCSCRYTAIDGTYLRCETNNSYEKTLAEYNNKMAFDEEFLSKDVYQNQCESGNQDLLTKHEILSTQDLRYTRLRHFRRRQIPLRYRHSIGSPIPDEFYQEQMSVKNDQQNEAPVTVEFVSKISPTINKTSETEELECNELDISSCLDIQKENPTEIINVKSSQSSIINKVNDDIADFGDDEVLRFFEAESNINFSTEASGQSLSEEQPSDQLLREFLSSVSGNNCQETNRKDKSVICQRDSVRFWDVIFRQTFDLAEENISVYFAGEPGADAGGPMRKFLTLCMKKIHQIADMFFGNQSNIFFKLNPKCMVKNYYYKLGQSAGFAICNIGRGPECFHPIVVKALFNKDVLELNVIPEIDDLDLKSVLEKIDHGVYDDLHDMSVGPSKDKDESKRLFTISFTILKHFGAINQFKMGLKSINEKFVHTDNYKIVQYFLQNKGNILTLKQLMDILKYHNDHDVGSILHNQVVDAICDFEIFLAGVSNDYYEDIKLRMFYFL